LQDAILYYGQQLAAGFAKEQRGADAEQLNCAGDYNSVAISAEVRNRLPGN
jgi:hypothetical protein